MKAAACFVGAFAVLGSGLCQAADESDPAACKKIVDSGARLVCFDTTVVEPAPTAESKKDGDKDSEPDQPKKKPWVELKIREKGDFSNFGGGDVVDKPGQLNLQRTDGKDGSGVKIAAIAAFRPINVLGWQPFAAGDWNRDTTGTKPKDLFDLSVGITGSLWDAFSPGWTLLPTLRAMHRRDEFGTTDLNALSLHINIITLKWVTMVEKPHENSYSFVPHLGYRAEHRNGGGKDEGRWGSAYVGLDTSAQLNGIMPRLSATLSYQRFSDLSAPSGQTKRQANYTVASIKYAFTDPEDKTATLKPSISLSHETGTDVLGGGDKTNKTSLGLGLKFN